MENYRSFKDKCSAEIINQGNNMLQSTLTQKWFEMANSSNYSYHFESFGRPIIQYPQDIVCVQELIYECKPDLIIETGIAHGGSIINSAAMLTLLDIFEGKDPRTSHRKVVAIDVDIRKHNREALASHPLNFKYELIEGSSIDSEIIKEVEQHALGNEKVMVMLDSMHTEDHVLSELNAYSKYVNVGSYIIVFDTIIERLPENTHPNRPWNVGNNPQTAIDKWLPENQNFESNIEIDNKLLISVAPNGYIKRVY